MTPQRRILNAMRGACNYLRLGGAKHGILCRVFFQHIEFYIPKDMGCYGGGGLKKRRRGDKMGNKRQSQGGVEGPKHFNYKRGKLKEHKGLPNGQGGGT